ncbi:uridine kinase [Amycolatopsis sp.]|uniref:uridine kinase family protein n=1 Tax=Amycolatopsis sp. TaxID=37632 RepID=UPI002C925057|nr:uridine kinase [Amycolatopsis sp.]HVV13332.1 uridine kinase [Amycolatopsis sp.]
MRCSEAADAILAAAPRLGAVRLAAIDGPSGSGKSTFAAALCDELRSRGRETFLIPTDHFATWDDPVAWWPLLRDGVLEPLARGENGSYRRLDWTSGEPRPGALVTVPPPEVLVIEGVSSGRASIRPRLSFRYLIDEPGPATRLERAVTRDGESDRQNLVRWQAFERGWFAADRT